MIIVALGFWVSPRVLSKGDRHREVFYFFVLFALLTLPGLTYNSIPDSTWQTLTAACGLVSLVLVAWSWYAPSDKARVLGLLSWLKGEEVPCAPSKADIVWSDDYMRRHYASHVWKKDALRSYVARHGCMPDGSEPPPELKQRDEIWDGEHEKQQDA
jgi:hypothetical protein